MKFLRLELKGGRVITAYSKGKYYKDFLYPFNKMHVYNMMCTLLDKTPYPQKREVDTIYLPFFQDVMDVVDKGYVKIELISSGENITTVKGNYDAEAKSAYQYTWQDCKNKCGDKFQLFKDLVEDKYNDIDFDNNAYNLGFERFIEMIVNREGLEDFKKLLNDNKFPKGLNNYIDLIKYNKRFRARDMYKNINRGIVTGNTYNATFFIPLNDKLKNEYDLYSKGWTNMLDGGLVEAFEYSELYSDDMIDFIEIKDLNVKTKTEYYNDLNDKIENNQEIVPDIIELLTTLKIKYDVEELEIMFKDVKIKQVDYKIEKLINKQL